MWLSGISNNIGIPGQTIYEDIIKLGNILSREITVGIDKTTRTSIYLGLSNDHVMPMLTLVEVWDGNSNKWARTDYTLNISVSEPPELYAPDNYRKVTGGHDYGSWTLMGRKI